MKKKIKYYFSFFLTNIIFLSMYRRLFLPCTLKASCKTFSSFRFFSLDSGKRNELTKHLSSLKEECKGQGFDLADMNDAAKEAGRAVQEKVRQLAIDDSLFNAKALTLSASVKAYHKRLANLQVEAQSIQAEVDALLKVMWGSENPEAANFATPPSSSFVASPSDASKQENSIGKKDGEQKTDGFEVEPPPIAQFVNDLSGNNTEKKVEKVEGEHLSSDTPIGGKPSVESAPGNVDAEVETIEIEVEPEPLDSAVDAVDSMKITDITSELYERGVNFSDCLDAKSLRQRYKAVLAGKFTPPSTSFKKAAEENKMQPPAPQRPEMHHSNYNYGSSSSQQSSANANQTGLAHDPYPNAQRKMIDPMRYVSDVKKELCSEQGIDPNSVDLWSGKVRLDDSKRLYDYPTVQSYPVEVRQKGDIPQ